MRCKVPQAAHTVPVAGLIRCRVLSAMLLLCLPVVVAAQSLYTARTLAEGTLYSDQVARTIGDLITVRVVETMTIQEKQETDLGRNNSMSVTPRLLPGSNRAPAAVGAGASGNLPGLDLSSQSRFSGEGEHSSSGRMLFTLSGRVVDVLDNGNMVIEARRQLRVHRDNKTVLLTGIVRPADIDPRNSIASTQIHNFHVSVEGEGPLTQQQQRGWLSRLIDAVWPF